MPDSDFIYSKSTIIQIRVYNVIFGFVFILMNCVFIMDKMQMFQDNCKKLNYPMSFHIPTVKIYKTFDELQ